MAYRLTSEVLSNDKVSDRFFLLGLAAAEVAGDSSPGQFVLLRGLTRGWPYLRRPFSIYSTDGESNIEILYKVVGRATSVMSNMAEGDEFELIGPLGRGFTLKERHPHTIALAGGIGIAPIPFFCQKYADILGRITLIVGARKRQELLVPVGLVVQGIDIRTYTEDGSKGTKGTVVDGFLRALKENETELCAVQVIGCGPKEMLLRVAGICREHGISCQVSVEEMMACGVGACMSCAVPQVGGGYLHACADGPVFDTSSIDWERWVAS